MGVENRMPKLVTPESNSPSEPSISIDTLDVLGNLLSIYQTPEQVFDLLGPNALTGVIGSTDPGLVKSLREGKERLDGEPGYFVLKNTQIDKYSYPLAKLIVNRLDINSF